MIQFSDELLETLLAPGISRFDGAVIPDLTGEFPEAEHWLSNFFLNSLFGPRFTNEWRQTAVSLMFRSQAALRAYRGAREKTLECVSAFAPGRPATKVYFEAVSEWEYVLLNIQIVMDLYCRVMAPGTSLPEDSNRIRLAANRIKHYAEDIQQGKSSAELNLPLWLSPAGLQTSVAHVTYQELAEELRGIAGAAGGLQNPAAFASRGPG